MRRKNEFVSEKGKEEKNENIMVQRTSYLKDEMLENVHLCSFIIHMMWNLFLLTCFIAPTSLHLAG